MNKIEKKKTKTKTEINYLRYVAILILKVKTGRAKQLKLTNTIKIVSQNFTKVDYCMRYGQKTQQFNIKLKSKTKQYFQKRQRVEKKTI